MIRDFQSRFHFTPSYAWCVGIERERFVADIKGRIVPETLAVLRALQEDGRFGPELSACQIEDRVGPCPIDDVVAQLWQNDQDLSVACKTVMLAYQTTEVAPETMPLVVCPAGDGRYQKIAEMIGPERLLAACRVAGTHIHVGMPDAGTALRVYNGVSQFCEQLCAIGDHSEGERLRLYRVVAGPAHPNKYHNWEEFARNARMRGFFENPRDCWDLIRISIHGTIEFRVFGVSDDHWEVEHWAKHCLALCQTFR